MLFFIWNRKVGLNAGLAPVEKAEIDSAANKKHGVADNLAGETGRHRPLQPPAGVENIGGVNSLPDKFDQKGRPGVACAGYAIEMDVGDGCDEQGRRNDPKGRDGFLDERGVVRVNGKHSVRENQHGEGAQDGKSDADEGYPFDDKWNLVRVFGSHRIADKGIGGGGQGLHGDEDKNVYTADDICDGQFPLADVLNREEKDEPRGEGYELLEHHKDGYA